jgi:hypothetical protein
MAAEQPPQSFARSEFLVVVMIYSTDTRIKSGFEQHAPSLFAARHCPADVQTNRRRSRKLA